MTSSIENNRMPRREFLKILRNTAAGVVLLGSLGTTLEACSSKSPEIVGLPVVLEMPFGSKFIVETKSPNLRLNLNKTLTEKLLRESVSKPTAPIKVSLYSEDWLSVLNDRVLAIDEQAYQSLPQEVRETFKDGLTNTVYDFNTGVPQGVAVHIATGLFLKAAREGKSMLVKNEFLPEGLYVNPIIAMNATFYHEVRYHALLRNADYGIWKLTEEAQEERAARKAETDWVKSLARMGSPVSNDNLFLIPY